VTAWRARPCGQRPPPTRALCQLQPCARCDQAAGDGSGPSAASCHAGVWRGLGRGGLQRGRQWQGTPSWSGGARKERGAPVCWDWGRARCPHPGPPSCPAAAPSVEGYRVGRGVPGVDPPALHCSTRAPTHLPGPPVAEGAAWCSPPPPRWWVWGEPPCPAPRRQGSGEQMGRGWWLSGGPCIPLQRPLLHRPLGIRLPPALARFPWGGVTLGHGGGQDHITAAPRCRWHPTAPGTLAWGVLVPTPPG